MEESKVNSEYRDRLFRFLFGREENKGYVLSLYNALNNTDYCNTDDVELYTIEDVIYIKMKNDVSFILDSRLSLWEQQSTYNPNMPVRGLMYFGKMFSKYISSNGYNLYGKKLIKLPTPRYVVFYNGIEERTPVEKMKLSDAFLVSDKSGEFEWTATVYNLNKGNNDELLEKCKPLRDYMTLIERIRIYKKETDDIMKAVRLAVDSCIEDGVLSEFLIAHKAEVLDMCITEYDEVSFVNGIKEEGREELNALNARLLEDNRLEDLKRSVTDREYQKKLFEEYFPKKQ